MPARPAARIPSKRQRRCKESFGLAGRRLVDGARFVVKLAIAGVLHVTTHRRSRVVDAVDARLGCASMQPQRQLSAQPQKLTNIVSYLREPDGNQIRAPGPWPPGVTR